MVPSWSISFSDVRAATAEQKSQPAKRRRCNRKLLKKLPVGSWLNAFHDAAVVPLNVD
jgi:hypothetical protein